LIFAFFWGFASDVTVFTEAAQAFFENDR